jgi:CheY-like chemotaxis protein
MIASTPKFLTPAEAAEQLRVSPITLRSWSEKGLIKTQVTAGGHRRYPLLEIERLLKQQGDSPLRIMLVDDDPFMLALLQEMLSNALPSAKVEAAGDGFEAGSKLITFMPDIVLLDLMMPRMDGFDVCRQIKQNPATTHIRVIAMTGELSGVNVEKVMSAGAEACLGKPVDNTELLRIIGLEDDRATTA